MDGHLLRSWLHGLNGWLEHNLVDGEGVLVGEGGGERERKRERDRQTDRHRQTETDINTLIINRQDHQ